MDPEQLCIDGGSAGGYTTLAAMAFRCTGVALHYTYEFKAALRPGNTAPRDVLGLLHVTAEVATSSALHPDVLWLAAGFC